MKFFLLFLVAMRAIPALSSMRGYIEPPRGRISLPSGSTKPDRLLQEQFEQIGLDIDGLEGEEYFGKSVAISDDGLKVAVSGDGTIRIFEYLEGDWSKTGQIDSVESLYESPSALEFSPSGNILAIGAKNDSSGLGIVRVFRNARSGWAQIGDNINGVEANDNFGKSLSISEDGRVIAIGASDNNGENGTDDSTGHVRIFEWDGSTWFQLGATLYGYASYDFFGISVALSSDGLVLAVGGPSNQHSGTNAGHVRVFVLRNTSWIKRGEVIDGKSSSDQSGSSLSISEDGSVVAIGAPGNNGGRVSVYEWDGMFWYQRGNDIEGEASGDQFGGCVSISNDGTVLAIGAPRNNGNGIGSGLVRVFHYQDDGWGQIGPGIDGEAKGDRSASALSLTGDGCVLAIGAPNNEDDVGHVRVFEVPLEGCSSISDPNEFEQIGSDIDGFANSFLGAAVTISDDGHKVAVNDGAKTRILEYSEGDWSQTGNIDSGYVIALEFSADGNILAIGAFDSSSVLGTVRVFQNVEGAWEQMGNNINVASGFILSGSPLAMSYDGTVIAIGDPGNDGENGNCQNKGVVHVFEWSSSTWVQVGAAIYGEADGDYFGTSVALSNNGMVLAVGGPRNNDMGIDVGHVRVFERTRRSWTQRGEDIDGETAGDHSGSSLSISEDGSVVAIGAPLNSAAGIYTGHERVYEWVENSWTQRGNDVEGDALGDRFGTSVSMSRNGTVLAIGAPDNDGKGFASGHVRVFHYEDASWKQIGPDVAGEAAGDASGNALSLTRDGCVLAIGAPNNENGVGHVRVFQVPLESCSSNGDSNNSLDNSSPDTAPNDCTLSAILDSTDDFCVIGIPNNGGDVCCDQRCGDCGGEDCDKLEGGETNGLGSSACCSGMIKAINRVCKDKRDQRCVIPSNVTTFDADTEGVECTVSIAIAATDDFCQIGVLNGSGDVCCDRSCGEFCGGSGCSNYNGGEANGLGSSACCTSMIRTINRVCEDELDQLCVIENVQ